MILPRIRVVLKGFLNVHLLVGRYYLGFCLACDLYAFVEFACENIHELM